MNTLLNVFQAVVQGAETRDGMFMRRTVTVLESRQRAAKLNTDNAWWLRAQWAFP
jgi:hypothetical protein